MQVVDKKLMLLTQYIRILDLDFLKNSISAGIISALKIVLT